MWRPLDDLEPFNRALIRLEQEFLSVLKGTQPLGVFLDSEIIEEVFSWIDGNPHQAFQMARIKSGHAMTPRHGINVMLMARAWAISAHKLGDRLNDFSLAALIHDLGHWRPDELVYVFGPFSHKEARRLREHVKPDDPDFSRLNPDIRAWVAQHHEQPDGKGYPAGVRDPHLLAQALRIVDCFEGLTTPRRFRLTYSWSDAMAVMERWAGFKYQRGLYKSFRGFLGAYPVGDFIQLKTGEAGLALTGNPSSLTFLALTNPEGDPIAEPETRTIDIALVQGEIPAWRELKIPTNWKYVRPDLAGLRRFYPSESQT